MLSTTNVNFQQLKDNTPKLKTSIEMDFDHLLENFERSLNEQYEYILTEVTDEQKRTLKKIDNIFATMKKALQSSDNAAKKKASKEFKTNLAKEMKAFTGVKNMDVRVDREIGLNAAVLPFYNKTFSLKKQTL